jgi:hypothetical protein
MTDIELQDQADKQAEFREPEPDPLAKEWSGRIESARKHWEKFHKRVKHNRKVVAGFDWTKDPDSTEFYTKRANLIHGTITAILPNIYARNPEISVTAQHGGRDLKLFCKTLETVTNRQMVDAKLKKRAKSTVKAALTCSMGVLKVMYQRDMAEDPIIKSRIQDTQDNIARLEELIARTRNPDGCGNEEAAIAELQQTLAALNESVEVVAAEGLVIDRVLTEHLLIDPTVAEFWDYEDADWMCQLIPMKKSTAEGQYKVKLDRAKSYRGAGHQSSDNGRMNSGIGSAPGDSQILICEIWDKRSGRIYTMAEGCDYWLREPFSPDKVGERWYPFFILPFQPVDGQFVGPSLVDLTEKLEAEHNETRDKKKKHRDAIKPGYIADKSNVAEKDIQAFTDSVMNEVTLIDAEGKPLNQVIVPKQHTPIDPMLYDTSEVRYDWEQVSGMQDAARSSVVQPKTATEASIMQQSLSGRVSEFRDQVEDFIQEIAQYSAQINLQQLTPQQVERIMGPHKIGPLTNPDGTPMVDPATGNAITGVIEPAYDWPQLSKEEVFDLVQLKIRAGTTGEPDKLEQQETWIKLMPVIQPLIMQIMDMQLKGIDTAALEALLRETVARFDDKLDIEQIMPKLQALPPPPMPPAGNVTPLSQAA